MMNVIQHNYHHRSNAYELFTYCSSLIYFSVAIVTITTKPKNITFAIVTFIIILLCYKITVTAITVTIAIVTTTIKLPYYCATDHFAIHI